MPGTHAGLSASSAKRWMSCPPPVKLEKQFPDSGSEYAAEGTLAHSLAEAIFRYNNSEVSKKVFSTRFNKIRADPMYNREMQDYIEDYTQYVWEIVNEVGAAYPSARILFEQRLGASEHVPGGFGAGDVVTVANDMVNIIGLKYGKGVGVSAENNPQLRLYGLDAHLEHSMLHGIRRIQMTIIRPRLRNISMEELTAKKLLDWVEREVQPKATQAYTGKGEFKIGDHCRFCKVRTTYKVHVEYNLGLAKLDLVDPTPLTSEEVGEVLGRADELDRWVKDVTGFALVEALEGTGYEGWELMEGTNRRRYTDQDAITIRLTVEGWEEGEIYKPQEFVDIMEMTKLTREKKFKELLSGLVTKPGGEPALAPESNKRPELSKVAEAEQDFDNKMDE